MAKKENGRSPWISRESRLPAEGKYVLARHNRGNWVDDQDQGNVNCVVVKLIRGISQKERAELEAKGDPRSKVIRSEDEYFNNLEPYFWNAFGPGSFFGQEISHWMPIPEAPEEVLRG